MKEESGHWYDPKTGEPHHWVPCKTKSGNRPTRITDAKKEGWVPSVTKIIGDVKRKPGLEDWLIRQAVYAVTTAPDAPGENLDAKITRVLDTEGQQKEEAEIAMGLGSRIHEAIGECLGNRRCEQNQPCPCQGDLGPYVKPAVAECLKRGSVIGIELPAIDPQYGGRIDLVLAGTDHSEIVVDFKTTKKLPEKGSWPEHRLQLAAYAQTRKNPCSRNTAVLYVSTAMPGEIRWWDNPSWRKDYLHGFVPLLTHWMWMNDYWPGV